MLRPFRRGFGRALNDQSCSLPRNNGQAEVTDGLSSGERVATTGAFELFKMDPDDLKKVKVQIAPAKEEEEPEES